MNRRGFLRLMGVGAATAALVPPSQVWPFRKIFLPAPINPYPPLTFTASTDFGFEVGQVVSVIFREELYQFHIDRIVKCSIEGFYDYGIVPAKSEEVTKYGRKKDGDRIDIGLPFPKQRSGSC